MTRIVIIGSKNGVHCRELTAAFEDRGARVRFADARTLAQAAGFSPENQAAGLSHAEDPDGTGIGGPFKDTDTADAGGGFKEADAAVIRGIPAGTLEQVIFRMDALAVEESRGLPFVNTPKTIEKTVDKYLTTALLEAAFLPVPPTLCVPSDRDMILKAFEDLGGDVVYKPLFGSCGNGLLRIRGKEDAEDLAASLAAEGRVAYLQSFIPSGGCDIRAFVLGGQVIAAMKRKGRDWRANLTLGGTAEAIDLTAGEEELALRAAAAVGAEAAGVDLLKGEDGRYYVIEVNGCPGWQGLKAVTGVDIAGELAEYVLKKAG